MEGGKALLRHRRSSWRIKHVVRRAGPVTAAIVVNLAMVAGFAAASGGGTSAPPVGRPPEPMAVTLVLSDFSPPPRRIRSPPQASASADEARTSMSNHRRKAKGPSAPMPEVDAGSDPAIDAGVGVSSDGVPAGLRGLLKSEPCGPTSERAGRSDCKGRYAKLVPPQDDWRLPDLHGYEVRFGEVVGVEEKHRRFLQAMALMGKPAGHLDPVWGD